MCQGLSLECLNCLFGVCSRKNRNFRCSIWIFIFFLIFGDTEVYEISRLLQTVLFLTDSIFYVLFAYFDESMGCIGGYEPWWSWNTVYIMLIWNWNEFTTAPKGSDLLYYTNGSQKVFLLSFVWMKCSKIEELLIWEGRGEERVQAWGCPRHPK